MRDLSMTPNAIRKRKKKTDPTIHLRDGDRNATYCRRAIFDNQVVIGEIITCTACINNLRKKGGGC